MHQLQAIIQPIFLLFRYVGIIAAAIILHLTIIFFLIDILPLVEFEVDKQLTHEQIQSLLERGKVSSIKPHNHDWQKWTEKFEMNNQTLEVYSTDSLPTTENNVDRLNIFMNNQINESTNLIVLDENNLSKLDLNNMIVIDDKHQSNINGFHYRYFLNMMPEIGITSCPHCSKVYTTM